MSPTLRVVVESEFVDPRSGEKNGKPWAMNVQAAWVYFVDPSGIPDKHPSKVKLTLEKGAPPYRIGEYILAPCSHFRGDFDSLQTRPTLWPVPAAAVKAA